jgi:hypothetical protein
MAGVAAIASFLPLTVSGLVFSSRRTNKALEADNPMVSIMNLDIATGQVFKASECALNIAQESKNKNGITNFITSAEENIKEMSKGAKALETAGKVVKFTADHINPIIMVTSGIKIATSDDVERAALVEVPAVGTMLFVTEPLYKKLVGISKTKRINGKLVAIEQDPLFKEQIEKAIEKNPFIEKQIKAISDFCKTSKFFKHAPNVLKGLGFVCASAGGYELGEWISKIAVDKFANKKENKHVNPFLQKTNKTKENLFTQNPFKQETKHVAA